MPLIGQRTGLSTVENVLVKTAAYTALPGDLVLTVTSLSLWTAATKHQVLLSVGASGLTQFRPYWIEDSSGNSYFDLSTEL